jgi:uncharacterized membrane protein required for colicin V production
MNLFDVLIVMALVGGAAWGFIKGIIHQSIGLGMIYVSILAATLSYSFVAPVLRKLVKLDAKTAAAVAFLLLLIIVLNLLGVAFRKVRKAEFKMLRLVNQLGGMTFGFVITCVWIALIIAMLYYASSTPIDWQDPGKQQLATLNWESIRRVFANGLSRSPMVGSFENILPLIISTVSPFVPTKDILNIFIIP